MTTSPSCFRAPRTTVVTESAWRVDEPQGLGIADGVPEVDVASRRSPPAGRSRARFDAFGPDRVAWGSDWPVTALAAAYGPAADVVLEALGHLEPDDSGRKFAGAARRVYGSAANGRSPGSAVRLEAA